MEVRALPLSRSPAVRCDGRVCVTARRVSCRMRTCVQHRFPFMQDIPCLGFSTATAGKPLLNSGKHLCLNCSCLFSSFARLHRSSDNIISVLSKLSSYPALKVSRLVSCPGWTVGSDPHPSVQTTAQWCEALHKTFLNVDNMLQRMVSVCSLTLTHPCVAPCCSLNTAFIQGYASTSLYFRRTCNRFMVFSLQYVWIFVGTRAYVC